MTFLQALGEQHTKRTVDLRRSCKIEYYKFNKNLYDILVTILSEETLTIWSIDCLLMNISFWTIRLTWIYLNTVGFSQTSPSTVASSALGTHLSDNRESHSHSAAPLVPLTVATFPSAGLQGLTCGAGPLRIPNSRGVLPRVRKNGKRDAGRRKDEQVSGAV